jgi:hypothetical protein
MAPSRTQWGDCACAIAAKWRSSDLATASAMPASGMNYS